MMWYPSTKEMKDEFREQYREAISDICCQCQDGTPTKLTVSSDNQWYSIFVKASMDYLNLRDECNAYAREHGVFQKNAPTVYISKNTQYGDIVFMVM
ncbi:hypothetical protein ACFQ44_05910 [Levilactobacillus lanxiensis]|uniref:Uncharacterized protein n=1 Tax=Levilactobacillus lanxiensis TaxID=2799568 RepID=A0ABW4D2P9_9LACO|nr:hypothetical protein [Levilactobacillus lanxiensis]